MRNTWTGVALVFLALGCSTDESEREPSLGVELANLDVGVRPQDDFFQHVNGTWLENTQIPVDKSNYGSFSLLADEAEANIRAIIEESAEADLAKGTDEQKIGDFYTSFMNEEAIEERGLQPLDAAFARIERIANHADVVEYFGYSQSARVQSPIGFFVGQDARNSEQYISYIGQSGLGMPDRDYYFKMDERFVEIRAAYLEHLERMLEMVEVRDPAGAARTIMDIETRIAEHHWTRVQNRDRDSTYNKVDLAGASDLAPRLDWETFFTAAGVGNVDEFVVRQPSYLQALDGLILDTPVDDWKTYSNWKLISRWAGNLPVRFVDENFDFYQRTLRGTEDVPPRWKRGVTAVQGALGEMLGSEYVERHFQLEKKARMDELVANLRRAFEISIDGLEWMGEDTKRQAQDKLQKFTPKIGFPNEFKDYTDLDAQDDDLIGNVMRSNTVEYRRMIDKLGSPVDPNEWFMTPQTVNAYYSSSRNEIVFPAAILQPPFFNVDADEATNYGAIGAVIGHEFSHGFDDQGRKSDGDGNLRNWWTEEDESEFKRRADGLVAQYDGFNPIDDMHVNGEMTLGENIGDLAGLTMAFRAYKLSLNGEEAPVIDGYTGDQRFFMGWAQVWQRRYRDDELRRRLLTDSHSPSEYRTNGIVSNMPEFVEAFDVQPGDGMYKAPEERVKIW